MTPYEQELKNIPRTLERARLANIDGFKNAIAGASEASIIAVGSGGSFTVASLLCSLHEAYTGRVSRAVTPLELICNPTLASTSPIFVISAEGKNPDILEALKRARWHSSRTVHVVTNRSDSPLMECVRQLNDVTPHVFELADKDGYLATNSLVLDATLTARAFEELDGQTPTPPDVSSLSVSGMPLQEWLASGQDFIQSAVSRRGLITVYSPRLRPIAEDLESKLSESALLTCQLADFRSFAHGRHLWLTERSQDTALLVLTEPDTENLWKDMEPQIPTDVPRFVMSLPGSTPNDLLGGLVSSMHLISELANCAERNIAKPQVSPLGRQLYYADLSALIPPPIEPGLRGEHSKYEVLGAHWPSPRRSGKLRRALEATEIAFARQRFRSIIFDYDGTLCSSNSLDVAPTKPVLNQIARLTGEGIIVGIASGRGGSIAEHLEQHLHASHWPNIRLGLYNGGWIGRMGEVPDKRFSDTREPDHFLSSVVWRAYFDHSEQSTIPTQHPVSGWRQHRKHVVRRRRCHETVRC